MEGKPISNIGQVAPALINQTLSSNPRSKHKTAFRNLGIAQIILGIAAVLLAIVNMFIFASSSGNAFSVIASGVWSGIPTIAAGSLGFKMSKSPSDCLIFSALALSIIATLTSGAMVGVEITGAILAKFFAFEEIERYVAAFHSVLAIIGFTEIVVAVTHCVYCYIIICGPSSKKGAAMVLQVLPGQPIVQSMAHPLYITTASGLYKYPAISQHHQLKPQHQQQQQLQKQEQQQPQQQEFNHMFQAGSVETMDVPAQYGKIPPGQVQTERAATSSEKKMSMP